MRRSVILLGLAGCLGLPATPSQAQVVTLLHTFTGGTGDGQNPAGALLLSGSTLYGMTAAGGSGGDGTLFQVAINGTGYNLTHSFLSGPNDGRNPNGSLIQAGSTLFGMTLAGGAGEGTIFQVGGNGAGFNLVHKFTGGASDGAEPYGTLLQSGSTFYGMTNAGGTANLGTVFKINTDGTGLTVIHSFTGGPNDGQSPFFATLVQSGSTLFGMTYNGGSAANGTIFKINTDGSGFGVLRSFAGGPGDGAFPQGSLIVSGSTLYGMTDFGGAAAGGTIFRMNLDGTGFSVMHSFPTTASDGANPLGDLLLVGGTLYGMTAVGGADALGTLFGINTDGGGYSLLHSFAGGAADGAEPQGNLIFAGSNLYGMTEIGGSSNDGVVFSFPVAVPEPSSFLLLAAAGSMALFARRHIRRALGRRRVPCPQLWAGMGCSVGV
jgi:uncharacterized repeat protein (TIGR03803 family)